MPPPNKNDDWGNDDKPVATDEQWGANDAPVGGMSKPAPAAFLDKAQNVAGRTLGAVAENANPLPLVKAAIPEALGGVGPINTLKGMFNYGSDAVGRTRKALGEGNYGEAAKSAVGAIPMIGAPAEQITREATEGRLPEAIGHAGGIWLGGKLVPRVGRGMQTVAEPLAESAMGVTARNRMYDANPGRAILTETRGVRPATVEASGRARLAQLGSQLETAAANSSSNNASLQPARDVIGREIVKAQGANAGKTAEQLQPMHNFVEGQPTEGFSGRTLQGPLPKNAGSPGDIDVNQSPLQVLQMRRAFPQNFNLNYGSDADRGIKATGKEMYRSFSDEVKRTVPEANELDPRIHSLIPAVERAGRTDQSASLPQRIMGRFGAHTGALVGASAGYATHGLPGLLAGIAIPEILGSPTVQMNAARALHGVGRGLQAPIAGHIGRLAPVIRIPEDEYVRSRGQ